jgi:Zn-dependent alcohol dehydrogenase
MQAVIEEFSPPAAGVVLVRILAANVWHSDLMLFD